jgi:hypothetical protein
LSNVPSCDAVIGNLRQRRLQSTCRPREPRTVRGQPAQFPKNSARATWVRPPPSKRPKRETLGTSGKSRLGARRSGAAWPRRLNVCCKLRKSRRGRSPPSVSPAALRFSRATRAARQGRALAGRANHDMVLLFTKFSRCAAARSELKRTNLAAYGRHRVDAPQRGGRRRSLEEKIDLAM